MSKWRSLGRLGKNGEDAPEPQENSFLLNHPVCACPISYCWSRNVIQYLSEYVLRITKIERISESEMVGLKFSEQGKCSKPNLPRLRDLGGEHQGWDPGWLLPPPSILVYSTCGWAGKPGLEPTVARNPGRFSLVVQAMAISTISVWSL